MTNPDIGTHLAVLNLFREADGSLFITVAGAEGAIAELEKSPGSFSGPPIDYIEGLIFQAASHFAPSLPEPPQ